MINNHLEPVFKTVLTAIDKAGIDYWVYGGVSAAIFAGQFVRSNKDVDIFVKEEDFLKLRAVLKIVCEQQNFKLEEPALLKNGRPKLDLKIDNEERLSAIPVYLQDNVVEFRFGNDSKK